MQTILGASGQIGRELALSLNRDFTSEIRLVSRNPKKVNDSDELVSADLLDAKQTLAAVAGSEMVYMTAGLPIDSQIWTERWPIMMRNVIDACAAHGTKLVYFDNTYMYPQTSVPQTEDSPFQPSGPKGRAREAITLMLLDAMDQGRVDAVSARIATNLTLLRSGLSRALRGTAVAARTGFPQQLIVIGCDNASFDCAKRGGAGRRSGAGESKLS